MLLRLVYYRIFLTNFVLLNYNLKKVYTNENNIREMLLYHSDQANDNTKM